MAIFGKQLIRKKGFIILSCKANYVNCPQGRHSVDNEECAGCVNFRKDFFEGGRIYRGEIVVETSCYQRQPGEPCLRGYVEFPNNDVCRKCLRYQAQVVEEKLGEEVKE